MSLYQILYQSQSLVPFEPLELAALLHCARINNEQHAISGILLYTPDGRFLQVLEGEADVVRHLYHQRIVADPRHYNCRVLCEGPCQHRSFPNWPMGFRHAHACHFRTLLGTAPPNNQSLLVPRPHTRPELLALLLEFAASGEEQVWLEQSH